MARYRGRHRAPSTTGRTIARTALAGAVAGAPLLAAAPAANAAPDSVWDRVAQCESSGNWNISTGNGFFGGLQFTSSTWRAFGGAQFAGSANQASREQQIIVAERVLAGQGWGAWPVCSRKAGATGEAVTLHLQLLEQPPLRPHAPQRERGEWRLLQRLLVSGVMRVLAERNRTRNEGDRSRKRGGGITHIAV